MFAAVAQRATASGSNSGQDKNRQNLFFSIATDIGVECRKSHVLYRAIALIAFGRLAYFAISLTNLFSIDYVITIAGCLLSHFVKDRTVRYSIRQIGLR
jgi:hypothetical protein